MGAQPLVELSQPGQNRPHLDDRVLAQLGSRAVGGAAVGLDLSPGEASVGDADVELRGFRHDGRVRPPAAQHRLGAQAGHLLVGHAGHDHVAGQPGLRRAGAGQQDRRQPALHVVSAAPVEASALDARLVRPVHALDAHGVQVRVQHQRAAAAASAGHTHHAGPAGLGLHRVNLQAFRLEPARHEPGDLRLPGAAGHQVGVHRVDRHQATEKLSRGCRWQAVLGRGRRSRARSRSRTGRGSRSR